MYNVCMAHKNIFAFIIILVALSGCGQDSVQELQAGGLRAFEDGNYKKARDYFLKGIALEPSNKELLYYTGLSYKNDYLYDSALFYLKRLDILYPKDRETNLRLYEIAIALEDWDYAMAAMGGLIGTGDSIEQYYAQYAEMWGRKDHPGNAYFYTKKAMDVEPDNPNHYVRAARLAVTVEPGPAAIKWIDSAIARFGENDGFLITKAEILARQESYPAAEKIFRSLLSNDTSHYAHKINLANVLSSQDNRSKKREALGLYREVVELAPPNFNLGSLILVLEEELK
jgi:tetratricopeptide (TPR) repeat protein